METEKLFKQSLKTLVGPVKIPKTLFRTIVQMYYEGRQYHNWNHVEDCLKVALSLEKVTDLEKALIIVSVLYHDCVYDTTEKDNEEKSALKMQDDMNLLTMKTYYIEEISRLIMLTKNHNVDTDDRVGKIIVDADLSILASDNYTSYAKNIRKEYSWVADDDFVKGRKKILEKFLNKSYIFHHKQLDEAKARYNIEMELKELSI